MGDFVSSPRHIWNAREVSKKLAVLPLMMAGRFEKLARILLLKEIKAYNLAFTVVETWVSGH